MNEKVIKNENSNELESNLHKEISLKMKSFMN